MVRVEDSVVMNFKVDGLGFRRMKEVVGQYQRWFVYDMGSSEVPGLAPLVAEYDESGNLVAKYHYDGGGLLAMTRNNESYWYGFEGIGTVRQLMGSQGQVVDAYAFDAWGNEITNPQSQVQNPFKYVGKYGYYWDTESALMLLGVRYYSAANGLFLSRDLIEGYGYTYAADNPIRWIDPQGLQSEEPKHQICSVVNGERMCAPSQGKNQKPIPSIPPPVNCINGKPVGVSPNDPSYSCYHKVCQLYKNCYDKVNDKINFLLGGTSSGPGAWLRCFRTNRCLPDCGPSHPYFSHCNRPGRAGRMGRFFNTSFCCVEATIRVCCWIEEPAIGVLEQWKNYNLKECKRNPRHTPSDICKDPVIITLFNLCN
jgi:RHS repeat-associated protein